MLTCGCTPTGFLVTPVRPNRELVETTLVREGWFAPKIAVIDVEGILVNAEGPPLLTDGEHAVSLLLEKLTRAAEDPAVKAVILRINSPGGTVAASELMHDQIVRFRRETEKPVIAVMMDVAASGGYYVACACDELIAHRSTVTGSIGVVLQLFDLTGTMAKIGITPHTIKSGQLKAAGSPFEQLTDPQRAVFQNVIDEMHAQFVEVVSAGRPKLDAARVRELADGRVYTARQALELGLIDRIGSLPDAMERAKEHAGLSRANVVAFHRPLGYVPNYYAYAPPAPAQVHLIHVEVPGSFLRFTPRFLYLWVP